MEPTPLAAERMPLVGAEACKDSATEPTTRRSPPTVCHSPHLILRRGSLAILGVRVLVAGTTAVAEAMGREASVARRARLVRQPSQAPRREMETASPQEGWEALD